VVSLGGKFCPICGRKVDVTVEGFCPECYKKMHPLMNRFPEVKVVLCRNCFSYKMDGRWRTPPSEASSVEDLVLHVAIKRIFQSVKKKNYEIVEARLEREKEGFVAVLKIKGRIHPSIPKSYTEEYKIPLMVTFTLCPACIDFKGKVERAVVQIRAKNRSLTPEEYKSIKTLVNDMIARISKDSREIIPIEVKGDKYIDITFSSQKAARKIASELQKSFPFKRKDTQKIIGVSGTGLPKAKTTIRLMLPEFKIGDIVSLSGKLYKVLSFEKGRIRLLSLNNYRETNFSVRNVFSRAKVAAREEDIKKVLVVSITPPYIQFMDLENYNVYEERFNQIPMWIKEGETVGVVKVGDKSFLVPLKT